MGFEPTRKNSLFQGLKNKLIPEEKPYRGPKEYRKGELLYVNNFTGEIDNFSGEEIIKENGKEIYHAKYIGGLVDQRR